MHIFSAYSKIVVENLMGDYFDGVGSDTFLGFCGMDNNNQGDFI